MPIITVCPECGCKIRTSEESAGKKVRCPECDESVVVGESSDDKQTEGKHAIQAERPQAKTDPASVSASRRPDDDDRPPEKRRRRDRDDDEDDDDERLRRRRRLRDRDDDDVDDGMTTLIPTGNPKALAAYYLGVFSLIPGLGMILGPLALIFGIKGKRFANANPKAKGWGHAIAGIVLGALTTFGHLTVILIVGIGIWYGTNKQKTENTEVQDRIAEIVKRSKEGGQPALPPPIKEEAPKVAQKMKPIDLPPTPLFKSTRDLLNPGRVLTVKPEAGLVAAVRVGSLQVTRVIFAPDAKTVAVNTSDGNLLIDMASSRTRPIDGEILAFSPDSASLVVIRRQAELSLLFLLNVATGQPTRMLTLSSKCDAAQFSPNGRYFVAAIFDPSIMELGVPKGNKLVRWNCDNWDNDPKTLLESTKSNFPALAFAPDGSTLAVAATEPKKGLGVCLLKPQSGNTKAWLHYQEKRQSLSSFSFSPDSKLLASSGGDGLIVIWDLVGGNPKITLKGHKQGLGSVVFAPQGDLLASRGFDGSIRLWDAKSGTMVAERANEDAATTDALAFTPDGNLLVTGSHGLLKAWDVTKLTKH